MYFSEIKIQNFRNLKSKTLTPSRRVNLIYGDNGSGKTTLLESMYLLGMGRSFRANGVDKMIADTASFFLSVVKLVNQIKT